MLLTVGLAMLPVGLSIIFHISFMLSSAHIIDLPSPYYRSAFAGSAFAAADSCYRLCIV